MGKNIKNKNIKQYIKNSHIYNIKLFDSSPFTGAEMNKMDVDYVFTHEEMISAMQEMDENDVPFISPDPSKSEIIAFQTFFTKMAKDFGILLWPFRDEKHSTEVDEIFWKDVNKILYPHLDVGFLKMIYTSGPDDYEKIVLPDMEKPNNKRKRGERLP